MTSRLAGYSTFLLLGYMLAANKLLTRAITRTLLTSTLAGGLCENVRPLNQNLYFYINIINLRSIQNDRIVFVTKNEMSISRQGLL